MSDSSPIIERKPRRKAPKITTSQDSPMQRSSKRNVPPSPGVPEIHGVLSASHLAASLSKSESSSASHHGFVPLAVSCDASATPPVAVPSDAPTAAGLAVPFNPKPYPKPKKARKRHVSQQGIVPLAVSSGAPSTPRLAVPPNPKPKKVSRRQQMLKNPFLALQAVECDSDGGSLEGSENSNDDRLNQYTVLAALSNTSTHTLCTFRHLTDLSYVTDGSYSDGDRAIYMASLGSQAEGLGFGTPLHQKRRGAFR